MAQNCRAKHYFAVDWPPVSQLVHLLVCQVRWRIQARWVAMHAARTKGVQVEVKKLDDTEKEWLFAMQMLVGFCQQLSV